MKNVLFKGVGLIAFLLFVSLNSYAQELKDKQGSGRHYILKSHRGYT